MKRGRTIAALAGLAAVLLASFLARYPVRGFGLPMGPDAPVYVWWARLAELDGLSVTGWRPGTPALTLMLGGTLGRSQLEIVAGLGGALAASLGLAAFAVARRGTSEGDGWGLLAGLLAGTWAVHLAGGYFGNLVFAVAFMAAIALLARPDRSSTIAAAILLGAGGAAHPMFMVVGIVILVLGALLAGAGSGSRGRILGAAAGGGALAGMGLLANTVGPGPLAADTSADAFMRRAGLAAELRSAYLTRFRHHWARYVPWLSLPFAWAGRRGTNQPIRAILDAWTLVALAGLAASLVTQLVPGVRLLAFAFAIPILAASGLARTSRAISNRVLASVVVSAVVIAMLFAAGLTWSRERPYAEPIVMDRIQTAADRLEVTAAGTPLVFVVDEPVDDGLLPFRVTNTGNLLRAHLPAERIDDVNVFVGDVGDLLARRPTLSGEPLHDALSRQSLADLDGTDLSTARVFILTSREALQEPPPGAESLLTIDVMPGEVDMPSPWAPVAAGVGILALVWIVGFGWARLILDDAVDRIALAPALGVAVLTVVGIAVDRAGLRLSSDVAMSATLLATVAGYLAASAAGYARVGTRRHPSEPSD